MAFAGVLSDADMKAALDGCSGEQLIMQWTGFIDSGPWSPKLSYKQAVHGINMCVPAADSFDYKVFFKACGLASKSAEDVKKAFAIIDQDNSGFIEEEELK